jgi:hypothetical protein
MRSYLGTVFLAMSVDRSLRFLRRLIFDEAD